MSRPRRTDPKVVKQAAKALEQAGSIEELRAAQAVLLPAVMGATLEQTAQMLGVGRATVARLQAKFRQKPRGKAALEKKRNWGGRRNALLSAEEEKEFLMPWLQQARSGGVLVVSPLRAALAQKLGRPVKASVIYRLLSRQGWRKVAPDTRHPKSEPEVQAEWKKNSPRRWRPC